MKLKKLVTIMSIFVVTAPVYATENLNNPITTSKIITPLSQAITAFDENNLADAKTQFETLLKADKKNIEALTYLARIYARQDKLDDAEDMIEKALKLAPDNAFVQNLSGKIYGSLASNASIFSAMGYAKDSLKGFTKAVDLDPDNIQYIDGLFSFHVNAPSIAGGDKDIALKLANKVYDLDKKKGVVALTQVYSVTENTKAAEQLFSSLDDELKLDTEILFGKAMYYQRSKNFSKATEIFKTIVAQPADSDDLIVRKYGALYQIGKTSQLSKTNLQEGIDALTQYDLEAPSDNASLPGKAWVKFRLANLIALQGDKKQAKEIYLALKRETKDENLLDAIDDEL